VAQQHLAGITDRCPGRWQDGVDHDRADHVNIMVLSSGAQPQARPTRGGHKGLSVHLQTFLIAFFAEQASRLECQHQQQQDQSGTSL
jgi:hypothetical protein